MAARYGHEAVVRQLLARADVEEGSIRWNAVVAGRGERARGGDQAAA